MQNIEHHSIDLLKKGLKNRSYTVKDLSLAEKSYTQFIAPNGGIWITRNTQISYPFVSCASTQISNDKNSAYDLAKEKGVRVPKTTKIHKDQLAKLQISELIAQGAVVVKPNGSTLSRGLTLDVDTEDKLKNALALAIEHDDMVLVQEQVTGEEIRFAVLNGKVKAAILREKPYVCGDGVSTIAELIEQENMMRAKITDTMVAYPPLEDVVNLNGHQMDTVLSAGERYELGKGTMIRFGASMYDVVDTIHHSYIETVETLAAELGFGFVVVDMMLDDYTAVQTDHNYAFIEFNKAPVLKLFYSCRDGKHFDVLSELVPMIDAAITQSVSHTAVLGAFEHVSFPEFGIEDAVAKVDTGAYSGALYCPSASVSKDNNGTDILTFSLYTDPEKYFKTDAFEKIQIRSSNGSSEIRYVICTDISVAGKTYTTSISLADRAKMRCPVLLGRKFIREHTMVVDVCKNEYLDDDVVESKI